MTVRELRLWAALYDSDPWGQERADLRAGTVAATVANCLTTKSSFKASDFMPHFGPREEPKPKTHEELKDIVIRMNALMGGKFHKPQRG